MKITFATIAIILFAGIAYCGEEAEPSNDELFKTIVEEDTYLSYKIKEVNKDEERAKERFEEAKKEFEKDMKKVHEDRIEAIESAMKRFTKKGNIRVATILMNKVDELKKDKSVVVSQTNLKQKDTKNDMSNKVIGKWIWNNVEVTFNKNGTIGGGGNWAIENNTVVINRNGRSYQITFSPDENILSGPRDDGLTLRIKRVLDN